MVDSVFPYPGGKGRYADWIINQFPDHETYVEPFGGAGTVLFNKPPSWLEIYNDPDGDLVQFFETLRDRGDELREWLGKTPHSRVLHDKYAEEFYDGYRPTDPIERAGRFFYLRYTQIAGKYNSNSGFLTRTTGNGPKAYNNAQSQLSAFSKRLASVTIESKGYQELIPQYDSPETLFYCDPPYLGTEDAYLHTDFSHSEFADTIAQTEGKWVISYSEVPNELDAIEGTETAVKDSVATMDLSNEGYKQKQETLVMNYDTKKTPSFAPAEQTTFAEVADGE